MWVGDKKADLKVRGCNGVGIDGGVVNVLGGAFTGIQEQPRNEDCGMKSTAGDVVLNTG